MGRSREERNEPVRIDGVVAVKETDAGLCVNVEGQEIWLPKSQIHDDSEVFDAKDNAEGTLVLPRWLAEDKGLA